jgi:hypothetical protein
MLPRVNQSRARDKAHSGENAMHAFYILFSKGPSTRSDLSGNRCRLNRAVGQSEIFIVLFSQTRIQRPSAPKGFRSDCVGLVSGFSGRRCLDFRGYDTKPSGPQCFMTGTAMAGGKEAMDDGRI